MVGKNKMLCIRKFVSTFYTSLVCKHKNMLKKGAPPEHFGILHHLLRMAFYGFNNPIKF